MIIAENKAIYIADIQVILPTIYKAAEVVKRVYCNGPKAISESFAEKTVNRINIKYRPLIIDPDALPERKLLKPEYSSLQWGITLIDRLTQIIPKKEIGFFGLAYNVSSVTETLPNLSARIISKSRLNLDIPPDEKVSYGCASGMLVLENAINYCHRFNKPAIVYVFDQCSWAANIIKDRDNPDFKNSFINSLLFGDGGAGLLIIPSGYKKQFSGNTLRIHHLVNAFQPADTLYFDQNGLQLDDKIQDKIPELAVNKIVIPLMHETQESPDSITEWSIHQGGVPILEQFGKKSLLGLNEKQLAPSRNLYLKYGNLSSASAFFVLNDHFYNQKPTGTKGIVLSYGAGFYLGGFLYEKK